MSDLRILIRLHLTNVRGAGATQLLQSLLPALEGDRRFFVERIYLPDAGALANYRSSSVATLTKRYRRFLPNALSRLLECTLFAGQFDGGSPLFVLGDMPLRCRGPQTVFIQQSNIIKPARLGLNVDCIKYFVARIVLQINLKCIKAVIVQTEVMRNALKRNYPELLCPVYVIPQPVPSWLISSGLRRSGRIGGISQKLNLIYPAAYYRHKNHALLKRLNPNMDWPVQRLVLTIEQKYHPSPKLPWVFCQGFLTPEEMIAAYSHVDGLLFLSKEESYGFPLVEAMYVGLPIICPNLAYARALCGDQAIYFDPDSPISLLSAFGVLQLKLESGWWPNWTDELLKIPSDWEAVASSMLEVATGQANSWGLG